MAMIAVNIDFKPTTAAAMAFGSGMYGFESPSLLQQKLDLDKEFQLVGIYLSQLDFATRMTCWNWYLAGYGIPHWRRHRCKGPPEEELRA